MAFTASGVWECRQDGDDTNNGGIFDPGVSGMATDLAATSGNTASPVVSSASYNFAAGDEGAYLYVKSGTNWIAGWYPIASVASNQATLDASVGAVVLAGGGRNTSVGCATVASPSSGTWSVDYSQQSAAEITYTDLVIDATTNTDATSAGHPFTINQVGNGVAVTSGTGFTVQRVVLTAIPSGVIGRFDKSLGTLGSTGGNGRLGGAVATIGIPGGLLVDGNRVFVKYSASAYVTNSVSNNVSGGAFVPANSTSTTEVLLRGYDTTRYDETANRPTIRAGVNSALLIKYGERTKVENLILDGNRGTYTGTTGIANGNASSHGIFARRLKLTGFGNAAILQQSRNTYFYDCEITDNANGSLYAVGGLNAFLMLDKCYIHDNVTDGLRIGSTNFYVIKNCIFDTNKSGSSFSHIRMTTAGFLFVMGCTFYNAGTHAIDLDVAPGLAHLFNNVFAGNGGYGVNLDAVASNVCLLGNAYYNNTSGEANNVDVEQRVGEITLTADPFGDAANGDFRPNSAAGGGLALRAASLYNTLPGLESYPGYADVGALQHLDGGRTAKQIYGPQGVILG